MAQGGSGAARGGCGGRRLNPLRPPHRSGRSCAVFSAHFHQFAGASAIPPPARFTRPLQGFRSQARSQALGELDRLANDQR